MGKNAFIAIIGMLLLFSQPLFAASVTKTACAGANAGGGKDWTNPNNACSGGYANVSNTALSSWLRAYGFGFTTSDIPAGSAIDGIVVQATKYAASTACFAGGTQIDAASPDQSVVKKEIKDLKVGDLVLGKGDNGSTALNKITAIRVHYNWSTVTIRTQHGEINTTDEHIFYTQSACEPTDASHAAGCKAQNVTKLVSELTTNDSLLQNGKLERILSIVHNNDSKTVYDLTTDGTHNYVANGFFVHNKEACLIVNYDETSVYLGLADGTRGIANYAAESTAPPSGRACIQDGGVDCWGWTSPGVPAIYTYDWATPAPQTDTWYETWNSGAGGSHDITDVDFGVWFAGSASTGTCTNQLYIGEVQITVYYTAPPAGPNTAPNITAISAVPSSPTKANTLSCNITVRDAEQSTTNATFEWYKNGANQTTLAGTKTNVANNTATLISNLTAGNFSKGQNWSCRVRVYDGANYSSWNMSANVTIANSAPTGAAVSDFSNASGDWFLVNGSVTDLDGGTDITRTNISASTGACTQKSNSTSSTTFRVQYNCTITTPATADVAIGFNDSTNYTQASGSNTYSCNNNGVCGAGETYANCPADCSCDNNGYCAAWENYVSCPADCPCNYDGFCGAGETYANCPLDCSASYNCTLSATSACSIYGTSPSCCQVGLICSIPSGTSGNCCIPSGSATACSANNYCCSGKCSGTSCVSGWGCGGACSASVDCGSSCPICATPSGGGSKVCSSCIPNASTTTCTSDSSCCAGTKCSPTTHLCESSFAENESCSADSDCVSSRCESPTQLGTKKCVAARLLSQKGGPCSSSLSCASNLDTLFCDYLNPPPNAAPGTGTCRISYPSGFACNASANCNENTTYTCKASPPLGNGTYCLASSSSGYLFPNWLKVGNATFSQTSTAHTGSSALQLSGGASSVNISYLYNTRLVLRNSSDYLLEFWTRGSGSDSVRYAIYDPTNDAYLNSSGGWEFNRTTPIISDSSSTAATYQRVTRSFRTLARNVSLVEVRFYAASSGAAVYLDDVLVAEAPDFTMMAYIRVPASQNSTLFYQVGTESGFPQGINWSMSGRKLNMTFYSANSTPTNISVEMNISDSNWHLVALSVDRAGNYSSYLDAVPYSNGSFGMGRLNASGQFIIGASNTSGGRPFNGSMDEVRFYRRALSAREISDHLAGRYQQMCSINITTIYNATGSLDAYYNAYLRARLQDSAALLSLPFDQNATANLPGAVQDYSRTLASAWHNATWTANGKVGGAYNFSLSRAAEAPAQVVPNGTGDFTLSAWVYPDAISATMYIIGNAYDSYNNGTVLGACAGSGKPCFYINKEYIQASTYTLSPNRWTHLAAVRRAGNGSIYADGANLNTAAGGATFISGWTAGTGTGNLSVSIGQQKSFIVGKAYIADSNVAYQGLIDEVRVFGRALSESEIGQLYRDSYLAVNSTLIAAGR